MGSMLEGNNNLYEMWRGSILETTFFSHSNQILLEKLIVIQQVRKFSNLYGSTEFITILVRANQ